MVKLSTTNYTLLELGVQGQLISTIHESSLRRGYMVKLLIKRLQKTLESEVHGQTIGQLCETNLMLNSLLSKIFYPPLLSSTPATQRSPPTESN